MNRHFSLYIWFLAGAAVVSVTLALLSWRRRSTPGAALFALLMLATAEWALMYALELESKNLPTALLWAKTGYLGIVTIPAAWLAFVLQHTGREKWLAHRRWLLLTVEPAITVPLVWTNEAHGLIWKEVSWQTCGAHNLLAVTHGAGWWVHLAYSYLVLLSGTLLLGWALVRSPRPYRYQNIALFLGALIPWIGNALYAFGLNPLPCLDLTPFAFALTGPVIAWGLFRYRLLDLVPVARDAVVMSMADGVIVLDKQNRIVDLNPAAEGIIGCPAADVIGQPARAVFSARPDLIERYRDVAQAQAEITLGRGMIQRTFDLRISPLYDQRHRLRGRVIVLRETTELQRAEEALRRREAILGAIAYAADRFLQTPDWEKEVQKVLARLGEATGVSRVYIFENHTGPGEELLTSQRYEWAAPDATPQIDNPDLQNFPYLEGGFGRWVDTMSRGEAIVGLVRDFPPSEQETLAAQGILSIVVAPIFVGGEWWGFIGFDECRLEREWTGTEIEALMMAADVVGAAICRGRSHRLLEEHARHQALLNEVTRIALGRADFQEMLQTLADRLGELFGADGAYITRWDEEQGLTIPCAAYGPMREVYPTMRPQPGEVTVTESVLRVGRPLAIEDVSNTPYLSPRIAAQFPTRSMLALPLIAGERWLGAVLISYEQFHRFTTEEIAHAEQVAAHIALAVAKAQALEETRRALAERQQAEEKLRQYALQLEARNEELDAFAHTVAHDLKSPLGLIVTTAEVLKENLTALPEEEVHHYLQSIARQGWKMNNIVEALLLLSSVRREEVPIHPLDMGGIVAEALSRLAPIVARSRAEIVLPENWPIAMGYAPWIEEVWVNYISNAIKYGGQPPRIEIGADSSAPPGMVRFWVRDNGPGLTPEEQSRLFTPFTRLTREGKGHGLGLSIVRRIVEKIGGQVGVESEAGRGCIFMFTLPQADAPPSSALPADEA